MTVFDQNDLESYVSLSRMALNLAGYSDDKIVLKLILDSLTEESRNKLTTLGLKEEDGFTLYDLQSVLNPETNQISLEDEFNMPQAANETVQNYLKRLKSLLPQLGEDSPSVDEFIEVFVKGFHPSLKQSVKFTMMDQIKRISRRNLKESIEQLEEMLKVIAKSSKENVLKPRNTCFHCKTKHCPLDLEDIEEAVDDFAD